MGLVGKNREVLPPALKTDGGLVAAAETLPQE
jgi:hypothetical protein